MLKRIYGAALVAALAGTTLSGAAAAQEKCEYRNATRVSGPDMQIVQNAVNELAGGAECNAVFTVSTEGKPKDIEPNCSDPRYDPYIVKAVESMEFLPEIFDGELFDTEGVKQQFTFGVVAAEATEDGQPPKVKKEIEPRDIERAINRVDKEGVCEIEYTVGVNGKPKDIQPNCDPSAFDDHIRTAIERMEYEPGMREGKAVDWPGVKMPLKLSKPNN